MGRERTSKETLLEDIQRLADAVGGTPGRSDYDETGNYHSE